MPRVSATSHGNKASSSPSKVSLCLIYPISSTPLIPSPCTSAVRGIGTSLATTMNWGANLLINSTYLSLVAAITPAGAFGFYAGLCLLGWLFCLFCFPETAGRTLEEIVEVFAQGHTFTAWRIPRHVGKKTLQEVIEKKHVESHDDHYSESEKEKA